MRSRQHQKNLAVAAVAELTPYLVRQCRAGLAFELRRQAFRQSADFLVDILVEDACRAEIKNLPTAR